LTTQTLETWKKAVHNHRLGHYQAAEELYHQILSSTPNDPHVLHSLGTMAYQRGQQTQALGYVTQAIAAAPGIAQFHNTQGVVFETLDRLEDAVAAYTRALSLSNDYTEAQTNLAIALQKQGHPDQALAQCQKIIQGDPKNAKAHHIQAYCQQQLGQRDQAVTAYEQALRLDPGLVDAANQLGVLLTEQCKYDRAIACFQRALKQAPDYAEAHNNLGISLRAQGQVQQAIAHYSEAIQLNPDFPEAYYNLANAQAELNLLDEAKGACARAIDLNPQYAPAYNQLGIILRQLGQDGQAVDAYQTAIKLDPQLAEPYNNLGIIYKEKGDFPQARQLYEQALALDPNGPETLYNLANVFKEQGHCQRAIQCYTRAIELKPDYADAHWNLSIAYLLKGDLAQGWTQYQWRTQAKLATSLCHHSYDRPAWTGTPFAGKRLLIYSEQGLGDTLQFVRYLPLVKALGGRILVETWAPLKRLLQSMSSIDRVIETSSEKIPDAEFDLCVSIMDLPRLFQTTLTSIPNQVPYLKAVQQDADLQKMRFNQDELNVGIVWAGAPTHGNDKNRSCDVRLFKPMTDMPGIKLYSLQKGPASAQLDKRPDWPMQNLVMSCQDLMDTACIMQHLDLIISVDTALAHLAGALGKPTWTLLPFAPDWRWLLKREDTPWYPTMRLFRQDMPGDWQEVFERVQQALGTFVHSHILFTGAN
jgi:tetratricopeptide (TPR) repeat protein